MFDSPAHIVSDDAVRWLSQNKKLHLEEHLQHLYKELMKPVNVELDLLSPFRYYWIPGYGPFIVDCETKYFTKYRTVELSMQHFDISNKKKNLFLQMRKKSDKNMCNICLYYRKWNHIWRIGLAFFLAWFFVLVYFFVLLWYTFRAKLFEYSSDGFNICTWIQKLYMYLCMSEYDIWINCGLRSEGILISINIVTFVPVGVSCEIP